MTPFGAFDRRQLLLGALALGSAAALGGCAQKEPGADSPAPSESASGDRTVDVLVIGAGIAGLAAAQHVVGSGRSCAVLEARDRVGGRIWTSGTWSDVPVDLGASWVHGTDSNPVYDEINRLGIATTVFDVGSFEGAGSAEYYAPDGTPLDADQSDARIAAVVAALERTAGDDGAGRTSMRAALDTLPAGLREQAREPEVAAALTDYAADFGATPADLALSALDEDDSYDGQQMVLPGGYGQLTQRLADELPVRLSTRVTAVSLRDRDHVVVETDSGQWRASKVIVTVPLGVLKSGAIRFDPPLPATHATAIQRLGMGRYEKLVLLFDTAFWDDVDQIQVLGRPGEPFTGWYNLNRMAGRPALMSLSGGTAAAKADGLTLPQKTAAAADQLARIYGDRFRPPVDAQASNWWDDEFSRGSYSFTAVGSGESDREALAEPIDDRLWLAGEASHPTFHSTVHGGWLSGRAAAEQSTS
jgi:monoamine oxidase